MAHEGFRSEVESTFRYAGLGSSCADVVSEVRVETDVLSLTFHSKKKEKKKGEEVWRTVGVATCAW